MLGAARGRKLWTRLRAAAFAKSKGEVTFVFEENAGFEGEATSVVKHSLDEADQSTSSGSAVSRTMRVNGWVKMREVRCASKDCA